MPESTFGHFMAFALFLSARPSLHGFFSSCSSLVAARLDGSGFRSHRR
jgi:hypothetical protein